MNEDIEALKLYEVILMLYFPKKQAVDTPTPNDTEEEEEHEEQIQRIENNYTPFLMELYPKSNKIKLFYKPLVDELDDKINDYHEHKRKYNVIYNGVFLGLT